MPNCSILSPLRGLALLALAAVALPATSLDLVVNTADGARHHVTVADDLLIALSDGSLAITSSEGTSDYLISDVMALTYESSNSAESVRSECHDIRLLPGRIEITGDDNADNLCTVCRTDGVIVAEKRFRGRTSIETGTLSAGIYVIRINNDHGLKISIR